MRIFHHDLTVLATAILLGLFVIQTAAQEGVSETSVTEEKTGGNEGAPLWQRVNAIYQDNVREVATQLDQIIVNRQRDQKVHEEVKTQLAVHKDLSANILTGPNQSRTMLRNTELPDQHDDKIFMRAMANGDYTSLESLNWIQAKSYASSSCTTMSGSQDNSYYPDGQCVSITSLGSSSKYTKTSSTSVTYVYYSDATCTTSSLSYTLTVGTCHSTTYVNVVTATFTFAEILTTHEMVLALWLGSSTCSSYPNQINGYATAIGGGSGSCMTTSSSGSGEYIKNTSSSSSYLKTVAIIIGIVTASVVLLCLLLVCTVGGGGFVVFVIVYKKMQNNMISSKENRSVSKAPKPF